jgi:hypothetical protein
LLYSTNGAIRELVPPKNERTLAGQERNGLIKSFDVTCRPGRLGISLVVEVVVPLYR